MIRMRTRLKRKASQINVSTHAAQSLLFVPGVMLIGLAAAAVFAPKLLVSFIAGILLFFGGMLCYLGWKLYSFKRKFQDMTKGFSTRVYVQGMQMDDPLDAEYSFEEGEDKKITYH